ncbi:MAG: hypothetical protein ACJ72Z_03865 [Pyrinomonadaceae bacterium]
MNRKKGILFVAVTTTMLLFGMNALAQVKRVQMHIAGYLCGN